MEVTTTQIATMIGKSERQVQRLIKSGKLAAHHIRLNVYSVNESDIDALKPVQVQSMDAENTEALLHRLEAMEEENRSYWQKFIADSDTHWQELVTTLRKEQEETERLITSLLHANSTPERLDERSAKTRPPVSVKAIRDDVPYHSIQMFIFAKTHGMSVETVRYQRKIGTIQTLDIDSSSRPGTKERYFTPEQQRHAVQVWKSNPRYHDCSLCPHVYEDETA